MAGKKPAKGNSSVKIKEAEQPGKLVKYIGAYKGVFHICPTCSSKVGRGLLYEFQNNMYCTRNCIPKTNVVL
jgi:hypothetical protein